MRRCRAVPCLKLHFLLLAPQHKPDTLEILTQSLAPTQRHVPPRHPLSQKASNKRKGFEFFSGPKPREDVSKSLACNAFQPWSANALWEKLRDLSKEHNPQPRTLRSEAALPQGRHPSAGLQPAQANREQEAKANGEGRSAPAALPRR